MSAPAQGRERHTRPGRWPWVGPAQVDFYQETCSPPSGSHRVPAHRERRSANVVLTPWTTLDSCSRTNRAGGRGAVLHRELRSANVFFTPWATLDSCVVWGRGCRSGFGARHREDVSEVAVFSAVALGGRVAHRRRERPIRRCLALPPLLQPEHLPANHVRGSRQPRSEGAGGVLGGGAWCCVVAPEVGAARSSGWLATGCLTSARWLACWLAGHGWKAGRGWMGGYSVGWVVT